MAKILDADPYRYPLAGSTIHQQEGHSYIAVGPDEIARLSYPQRKGVETLVATSQSAVGLVGLLSTDDGTLYFTSGGSPIVASVTSKGKATKKVKWL